MAEFNGYRSPTYGAPKGNPGNSSRVNSWQSMLMGRGASVPGRPAAPRPVSQPGSNGVADAHGRQWDEQYRQYAPQSEDTYFPPKTPPSRAQQSYDAIWGPYDPASQPVTLNDLGGMPANQQFSPSPVDAGYLDSQMRTRQENALASNFGLPGAAAPPSVRDTKATYQALGQAVGAAFRPLQQFGQAVAGSMPDTSGAFRAVQQGTQDLKQMYQDKFDERVQQAANSPLVGMKEYQYPPITNITGANGKPLPNPAPASAAGASYQGGPTPQQMREYGITPYSVALGQNPVYDNVATGMTGLTRDISRAQVADRFDPQSWETLSTTPQEQAAKRLAEAGNIGARYESRIRQDPYSPAASPGRAAGLNALAAKEKAEKEAAEAAYQKNRQNNIRQLEAQDAALRAQGRDPVKERNDASWMNAQYSNHIRAMRQLGAKPLSYAEFAAIKNGTAQQAPPAQNAPPQTAPAQTAPAQPAPPVQQGKDSMPPAASASTDSQATRNESGQQYASLPDEGSPPAPKSSSQQAPQYASLPGEGSPPAQQAPATEAPAQQASEVTAQFGLPNALRAGAETLNRAIDMGRSANAAQPPQSAGQADPNYPFNGTTPLPTPVRSGLTLNDLENIQQNYRNTVNGMRQAAKEDRERRRLVGGPSLPMATYMMQRFGIPMALGMPQGEEERRQYIESLAASGYRPAQGMLASKQTSDALADSNKAEVEKARLHSDAITAAAQTKADSDQEIARIQGQTEQEKYKAQELARQQQAERDEMARIQSQFDQRMGALDSLPMSPSQKARAQLEIIKNIEAQSSSPLPPRMLGMKEALQSQLGMPPTNGATPNGATPNGATPNGAASQFGLPESPASQQQSSVPPPIANLLNNQNQRMRPSKFQQIQDPAARQTAMQNTAYQNQHLTSGNSFDEAQQFANQLDINGLSAASPQEILGALQGTPLGAALSTPAAVANLLQEYLTRQSAFVDQHQKAKYNWYQSTFAPSIDQSKSNLQAIRDEGARLFNDQNSGMLNMLKNLYGDNQVRNATTDFYADQWFPPSPY